MQARTMVVMVAVAAMLLAAGRAKADVFNMGGTRNPDGTWNGLASLEMVPVGDPGNAVDARFGGGHGAVGDAYNIGKYEVTAGQYCAFLNAVAKIDTYGLYNIHMDTYNGTDACNIKRTGLSGSFVYSVSADWANLPVNFVSWGDAARFANWIHNGQPTGAQNSGTTEDGAYYLNGATTEAELSAVTRKTNWKCAITSEDEWYKAAYYKSGSTNAGYWFYPTSSNDMPQNTLINPDPGHQANYSQPNGPPYMTHVGEFENSASPYGTFDQGGNVWEWNEMIRYDSGYSMRGIRGGSCYTFGSYLAADFRGYSVVTSELNNIGFRIVTVPEPASLAFLFAGGLMLLKRRRR